MRRIRDNNVFALTLTICLSAALAASAQIGSAPSKLSLFTAMLGGGAGAQQAAPQRVSSSAFNDAGDGAELQQAKQSTESVPAPEGVKPGYVYAYPGKTCPKGSEVFKGPEQALAAESSAVYCQFIRSVTVVEKDAAHQSCPPGTTPFTDPKNPTPANVLWCR